MKSKKYNLATITVLENGKYGVGIKKKRELTLREAKYILKNIFGINICNREDFDSRDEYEDYNHMLLNDSNDWLDGKVDDSNIMEYAYDCSDESIGIFNVFRLVEYLQKRNIV